MQTAKTCELNDVMEHDRCRCCGSAGDVHAMVKICEGDCG